MQQLVGAHVLAGRLCMIRLEQVVTETAELRAFLREELVEWRIEQSNRDLKSVHCTGERMGELK